MTQYRFTEKSQLEVSADSLEDAIRVYHAEKEKKRMQGFKRVERIEIVDESGRILPVDRPLRSGDVEKREKVIH